MKLFEYETEESFDYENGFYLTSDISRVGKLLSHYELYKMIHELPGDVVETGVFKGASFLRWLSFRNLLENQKSRKVIGFDSFAQFPETSFEKDKPYVKRFTEESGEHSISKEELEHICSFKQFENFELVKGDIVQTLPEYFNHKPHTKIALLHIDTDVYEPAKIALETLWPRVVKGGIVIFDDYGTFPGETQAVDEFFKDKDVEFKKLTISHKIPVYIKKEHI